MYANRKMRPIETLPGMGGGEIKVDDRGGEFNYDILQELVNVTMYPQYNNLNKTLKAQ
jgi:hypothetical protein